jgi:Protein of unknown function (DUF664)
VAEVRTYRTKRGRRAEFVELFQHRAGPAQRALGIPVIGPLLDTDDPDVLVWLRAFPSERERGPIKASFYDGPMWTEELEGLVMPLLAEYSAVVCEIPAVFLDGPLRPQASQPERSFGWQTYFVQPDDDPRVNGGFEGERATLMGYLRDRRLTLELKCSGLDAEAMARRSVEPSDLSLLGLIRHLTDVEQYWFRYAMAGRELSWPYRTGSDPDAALNGAVPDPELVEQAWAAWRAEVEFADRVVAEAPDLDLIGRNGRQPISLREVLVVMIDEYARHCGHADFLRERIDGRIGI